MRIKGGGTSFPVEMMTEEEFVSRMTPKSDGSRYYASGDTDIVFARSLDEMQEFADKLFTVEAHVRPVHLFVVAGEVMMGGMTSVGTSARRPGEGKEVDS